MTTDGRAFATVDEGTATIAVSLVGRVEGRWRLLGATAAPAGTPADPLLARVAGRVADADPALARDLGLARASDAADLDRLACRTAPPPQLAVLAATARVLGPLAAVASRAGWRVRPIALQDSSVLEVATVLADPAVDAVLAGASDPPGADERPLAGELAMVLAGALLRRPDLPAVLAGGLGAPGARDTLPLPADRPGATVLGPAPGTGDPPGEPLRALLDELRAGQDGRRAIARAAGTLAVVLERRVEVVEVGQTGGLRAVAEMAPSEAVPSVRTALVADAALVPPTGEDDAVDAVLAWLSVPLDRLRLRDRLRELALAPWADAAGEGALLRLAAARAALARLDAATPDLAALPMPDLLLAAGGAWAAAPGPAVALALADVIRRPGATALGLDAGRLLGPLGTVPDEAERRALVRDLRDDLVTPLGSVLMPAGLRQGRSAGRLVLHGAAGPSELDLVPGGLELVDLPPGERAVVEVRFRDPVDLGIRGRHLAVELAGGLGGLFVDLRDIPLRLPSRLERRRELLAAWQAALWAGLEA